MRGILDQWNIVRHRLTQDQSQSAHRQMVQQVTRLLWERLIGPWIDLIDDEQIRELIIGPYDALCHVPWAALYDGAHWLAERFALTVTPSLSLWAAPYPFDTISLGPPCLLGASGAGDRKLIHVEGELAAIARSFPTATVIPAATLADLRAVERPRLLHIAAHGQTDPTAPLCSTLELADGPFLLAEVQSLRLQGARLVTLSACETSVRPDHGDMALALAGAFLSAGARAVLASLWPVSDAATALLMEKWYAALAQKMPPARALRQAQLALWPRFALDWAAFQLWAGAPDAA